MEVKILFGPGSLPFNRFGLVSYISMVYDTVSIGSVEEGLFSSSNKRISFAMGIDKWHTYILTGGLLGLSTKEFVIGMNFRVG